MQNLKNINLKKQEQHPFHLVDPSPWPISTSLSCNIVSKLIKQKEIKTNSRNIYSLSLFCKKHFYKKVSRGKIYNDTPYTWQLGFTSPATHSMEAIIDLYHDLMIIMIFLSIFVSWMLFRGTYLFYLNKNLTSFVCHDNAPEVAWTITPAILLLAVIVKNLLVLHLVGDLITPQDIKPSSGVFFASPAEGLSALGCLKALSQGFCDGLIVVFTGEVLHYFFPWWSPPWKEEPVTPCGCPASLEGNKELDSSKDKKKGETSFWVILGWGCLGGILMYVLRK
jgi:hypothetical protein